MNNRIAILALVTATTSYADGPTPIHGLNAIGEELYVYSDGTIPVEGGKVDAYTVRVVKHGEQRFQNSETYRKQRCNVVPLIAGKPGFICDPSSDSPLAGANYIYASDLPDCGGTRLVCQTGCGSRAPRELIIDPWECPEDPNVLKEAACGNPIDEGVVEGDNVNIRSKPSINSSVLRTAMHGVRITVLKRGPACILLNGKEGRWVQVKFHDNNPVREGWVFDAYVKYEYHQK